MKYSIPKILTTGLFEEQYHNDKYLNRKNSYWVIKDQKFISILGFACAQKSKFKLMFKEYLL